MNTKIEIKCLDLFCGVGGAGEGYARAGFHVTGIDNVHQPNHPRNTKHHFMLDDALEYLKKYGFLFDFIHASPPCQKYSNSTAPMRAKGKEYPDMIEPIRNELIKLGKPYVIENVMQAPIRKDLVLQGTMFGVPIKKKRKFELGGGLFMLQPTIGRTNKTVKNGDLMQVVGKGQLGVSKGKKYKHSKGSILEDWRHGMEMPWAKTYKELANAIPPAYTEFIALHIKNQIHGNKHQ